MTYATISSDLYFEANLPANFSGYDGWSCCAVKLNDLIVSIRNDGKMYTTISGQIVVENDIRQIGWRSAEIQVPTEEDYIKWVKYLGNFSPTRVLPPAPKTQ